MKVKDAIELGKVCGLDTIEESINNVILHSTMLFKYEDITEELEELKNEAKNIGIKFCSNCDFAMIENRCYMCENLIKDIKVLDE